ncbi:uncharacterized protein LOC111866307 isoform X2 [Cryptotermes secundus]|uniref:uncharacterized protein LOC111866307 isoform X2 n=1 Tax=Cryptotermes secundus TaxID=105785 RepID=UPI000CD7D9A3|nr:uncharacterized protein LOC111866307 isoform X2 [Cryptotermes secundus]
MFVGLEPLERYSACGIERRNSSGNECSNSHEQRNRTTENSDSVESIECALGSDVCCLGVTEATKEESNFKESKEGVAHYEHMAIKSAVTEEFVRDIYRMKETQHMSESEDSDSVSTCHSRRELVYSQKLVSDSASSVKLADSSCKKKKVHDVPRREGSGSDSTDDFIETSSLLSNEEYSLVTIGGASELENLTEEEEIWMIQCPISINPQDLQNEELVFGGKSDFTLQLGDGEKYETACYVDRKKPVPCLLPGRKKGSFKAKVLQPEGLIVIMEKVEIPELKITLPKQSNFQIPNGLTVRHPLFGQDYKEDLTAQKGFTNQHRRMIHEDLLIKPNRIKKEKKKDRNVNSGYISESKGTCDERQNLQTNDGWHKDNHHKNKKKNKNKEKQYDAEECKRKVDEDIFERSELLDAKRKKKKASMRKCIST